MKTQGSTIAERVAAARAGENPYAICRLKSGWVIAFDDQPVEGYCLLISDPIVPTINALNEEERARFLLDATRVGDAVLHITGAAPTTHGTGQFHFQFYAAPNMDVPMFPGASRDPERFLYLMAPNIEDIEAIRDAQNGLGNDRVVVGIRTVGETFGARTTPIGSDLGVSWMNVNPFGGSGCRSFAD